MVKRQFWLHAAVAFVPVIAVAFTIVVRAVQKNTNDASDGVFDVKPNLTCEYCKYEFITDSTNLCKYSAKKYTTSELFRIGYSPSANTEIDKIMNYIKERLTIMAAFVPPFGPPGPPFAPPGCTFALQSFPHGGKGALYDGEFFLNFDTRDPNVIKYDFIPGYDIYKNRAIVNPWYTKYDLPYAPPTVKLKDKYLYNRNDIRGMLIIILKLVGDAIIWKEAGGSILPTQSVAEIYIQPFTYPNESGEYSVLGDFIPYVLMCCMLAMAPIWTKNIIVEKERKLKETMKMMGVSISCYWISWVLSMFLYIMPAWVIVSVLMKVNITHDSDWFLLVAVMTTWIISLMATIIMCSTLVQRANIGAVLVFTLMGIAVFIPQIKIEAHYERSRLEKLLLPLQTNYALGMSLLFFQHRPGGVQWSNVNEPMPYDDVTLLEVMLMTLVGAAIMFIVAWYMDNVWPGECGVPKPPHFFLTKNYWFPKSETWVAGDSSNFKNVQSKYFEKEPENLRPGIEIKNLCKTFDNKTVVNGLNLTMYEDQITVLLGHNGAGKTTTMSMLTGFIPPSAGTAIVNGCDIRKNMEGVRRGLGLCPQHNVLFDTLTVDEHLKLFAYLKGVSRQDLDKTCAIAASDVGLAESRKKKSKALSGGQKRKLSVGIALVGGSKVVILDEPSAGMDVDARRQMWELLLQARKGRTLLMSTHYMDEADVLGDRIAIMVDGVVKCYGASPFLKKLYGVGYRLIVEKEKKSAFDAKRLTTFIQTFVENATVESYCWDEITYVLPDSSSAHFPQLFGGLDYEKSTLLISGYGLAETSMEEVFLKVGDEITTAPSDQRRFSSPKHGDQVGNESGRSSRMSRTTKNTFNSAPHGPSTSEVINNRRKEDGNYQHPHSRDSTSVDVNNGPVLDTGETHSQSEKSRDSHVDPEITQVKSTNTAGGALYRNTFTHKKSQAYAILVKKSLMILRRPIATLLQVLIVVALVILSLMTSDHKLVDETRRSFSVVSSRGIHTKVPNVLSETNSNSEGFRDKYLGLLGTNDTADSVSTERCPPNSSYFCFYSDIFPFNSMQFSKGPKAWCDYGVFQPGCAARWMDEHSVKLANDLGTLEYTQKVVLGMRLVTPDPKPGDNVEAVAYYGRQAFHSIPISLQYLVNAMVQFHTGNSNLRIESSLLPPALPVVKSDKKTLEKPPDNAADYQYGLLMLIRSAAVLLTGLLLLGLILHMSWFVPSLIREKQVGAKHMQLLSGVSTATYWLPTFIMDFSVYLLTALLVLVVYAVGQPAFAQNAGLVFSTFFLFGLASLPFLYVFHFLFNTPQTGFVAAIGCQMFGITIGLSFFYIQLQLPSNTDLYTLYEHIDILVACVFPIYAFLDCIAGIYKVWNNEATCLYKCALKYQNLECQGVVKQMCAPSYNASDTYVDYLEWSYPGIEMYLCILGLQCIVYSCLVVGIENRILASWWYKLRRGGGSTNVEKDAGVADDEDHDVAEERRQVHEIADPKASAQHSILIKDLVKRYDAPMCSEGKGFTAVDNICVGVEERECFGLLGVNGAGKTSTFKMLTGDTLITSGHIYVKGLDAKTRMRKIQSEMGYCPQFDPLIMELTAVETLKLFGRLRGVPPGQLDDTVHTLIKRMTLEEHANKQCGKYSGGNKRKLSTAVALIGDPPIVLLDEPTAGMDPEARRHIWNVISEVRESGRTMVLTSHSMEECEALCTKVAIMIKGKFRCLGSTQHLKNRFGQGYTLVVQMRLNEDNTYAEKGPVVGFIMQQLPGAMMFEEHQGYLHFHIPTEASNLAAIFHMMEWAKCNLSVQNYSVSQASLEQLFLALSREKQ